MATTPGVIFAGKPTQVETGTHNGARNKPNEDRFDAFVGLGSNGQPAQFLVVADGVTSTHGGERASDIAVRVLRRLLQSPVTSSRAPKPLQDRLAEAIHAANKEILDTARKDPELKGMSTTLVVAAIDGDQLILMHLGDSRAYLIRSGKAYQLTRDHTWIQDAMDEGRITPEQARTHPNKHVIQRYLGDARGVAIDPGIQDPARPLENPDQTEMSGPTPRPSDTTMTLRPGDALLLCSDGLYNRITDEEIAAAATEYAPEKAVRSLIEQAVKRDEPDNITIVFWPTGGAPVAVAAVATRRPVTALALAAAGILLALAAVWFIFGQSGGQQAGPPAGGEPAVAAVATPADVQAAVPPPAATETPAPTATEPPTATKTATEPPTEIPTQTPSDAPTADPTLLDPTQAAAALPQAVTSPTVVVPPTATALPQSTGAISEPEQNEPTPTTPSVSPEDATMAAVAATQAVGIGNTRAVTPTSGNGALRTGSATSTPLPPLQTATSTATSTPVPTRRANTQTPTNTPGNLPVPSGTAVIDENSTTAAKVLNPKNGESSANSTKFEWEYEGQLGANQAFEVVFWQSPKTAWDGYGYGGSTTNTFVDVNPAVFPAPGLYKWALFLVTTQPEYRRLKQLAGPYEFTAEGNSGDNSGDNSGGNSGEGNQKP